jgi:hypothetical protein
MAQRSLLGSITASGEGAGGTPRRAAIAFGL